MGRIITKEESEIVLSENGEWFHQGEPFENPKVIAFFHRAIRKDQSGVYYLYNAYEEKEEAVYFEVKDTAYFIKSVTFDEQDQLFRARLNTEVEVEIDLKTLEEDRRGVMYCRVLDNDRARFSKYALVELSKYATMEDDKVFIELAGEKIPIG
jgi:hypothetical protein